MSIKQETCRRLGLPCDGVAITHLTAGQLATALRAFKACEALTERGARGIDAALIEVMAEAIAGITGADQKVILGLPLVEQSVDNIRQIIKPCGLSPRKSAAIHRLSEILLEQHNGQVPESFEALEALPGVGHKTASVVMSQGFGHPAFPVDTHIHRLAQRWGLSKGRNVEQTERDLKNCSPRVTGTACTYKSSFMAESTALRAVVTERTVRCVAPYTPIERHPLRSTRHSKLKF